MYTRRRDLAMFRHGYREGYLAACRAMIDNTKELGLSAMEKSKDYTFIDLNDNMIADLTEDIK